VVIAAKINVYTALGNMDASSYQKMKINKDICSFAIGYAD
jgi:hypothetical protein